MALQVRIRLRTTDLSWTTLMYSSTFEKCGSPYVRFVIVVMPPIDSSEPSFFKLLADQNRVDLFLLFEQRDHRREDPAIQRRIKILWF